MGRKIDDHFIIKIEDMSDRGEGIGRDNGFIWFVRDTVPGDVVEAAVTGVKKTYGHAVAVHFLLHSPDRVEPFCPYFSHCGGCQLQAIDYLSQLRLKDEMVKNQLKRIGAVANADELVRPVLGMDNPWRYRNNEQFFPGLEENGRPAFGFYAERTHRMIRQDDCLVGAQENSPILRVIQKYMEDYNIRPYDENDQSGTVNRVQIRKGFATGDILVCLKIHGHISDLKEPQVLIDRLTALFPDYQSGMCAPDEPHIESVCCQILDTKGAEGAVVNLYGPGFITEKTGHITYRISPASFFQVNPSQTERLYKTVLSMAALGGSETVWDLYCGIGTISLLLAKSAKQVYGVEIVPQAVNDARENARLNGIENVSFFAGKAEQILPRQYEKNRIFADVTVLDPPRKGCGKACLDTIIKMRPSRIVYVSCDAATLSRDVKILSEGGYELKQVQPIDMFPQTIHIENVCLLLRSGEKDDHDTVT